MQVLHVSSGNLFGGIETLLLTLARFRHLCPEMEPHFAFAFEGRVSQELTTLGVPVHQLGEVRASRPWTVLRGRRKLKSLVRLHKFDAVICHDQWPLAVFGPAVSVSSKLIFWMHGSTEGRHWLDTWTRTIVPTLVICNSRFTASSVACLYKKMESRIVASPVNQIVHRSAANQLRIRQDNGVANNDVVIIQVSRMEPWKGHPLHLNSLALLKDIPNWQCWLVGGAQRDKEQDYVKSLEQLAESLGIANRVRFLGQRADVPELLAAADIFCQPNRDPEPFGIVFIEALLAGLPVVATALGGALEIVDSSCGVLTAPGDACSLADTLRQLIKSKDARNMLGQSGPRRAHQLCDPQSQLKLLSRVLSQTVQSSAVRLQTQC